MPPGNLVVIRQFRDGMRAEGGWRVPGYVQRGARFSAEVCTRAIPCSASVSRRMLRVAGKRRTADAAIMLSI